MKQHTNTVQNTLFCYQELWLWPNKDSFLYGCFHTSHLVCNCHNSFTQFYLRIQITHWQPSAFQSFPSWLLPHRGGERYISCGCSSERSRRFIHVPVTADVAPSPVPPLFLFYIVAKKTLIWQQSCQLTLVPGNPLPLHSSAEMEKRLSERKIQYSPAILEGELSLHLSEIDGGRVFMKLYHPQSPPLFPSE